jgi:hypothetical protein
MMIPSPGSRAGLDLDCQYNRDQQGTLLLSPFLFLPPLLLLDGLTPLPTVLSQL